MAASVVSALTASSAGDATTPIVQAARPENAVAARIDFALVVDEQFLIYGWILGFTKSVHAASIHLGKTVIDLVKQAIPVRRPDVAQHFSLETGDDEHGFYALIDLPDKVAFVVHVKLSVTLLSGETAESLWPISRRDALAASGAEPYVTTLNGLLPYLPRQEAKRLNEFTTLHMGAGYFPMLSPPARFGVDLCCVLESRILFASGWVFDPAHDLTLAELRVGGSVFDFSQNSASISHPDISPDHPSLLYRKQDTARLPGFILAQPIPQQDAEADEARFTVAAGAETVHVTRKVSHVPQEARRDFLSFVSKMDPDSALVLIERVAAVLDNLPEPRSPGAWRSDRVSASIANG